MREMIAMKEVRNRYRYETATKDPAFASICDRPLIDTQAEHFLAVLRAGAVSTNMYLRRFHTSPSE